MRLAHGLLLLALASSSVACLRKTEFACTTSAECGPGGQCQAAVGFCSVYDPNCATLQRYGDSAGEYAGQCVNGGTPGDAGSRDAEPDLDGPPDAPPSDAPLTGCPAGYTEISGGQAGHMYRFVATTASWSDQRTNCELEAIGGAIVYLAVPDNAPELEAIAQRTTSTQFWVGITDQLAEGTWRNTLGVTQTFLPWGSGRPSTSPNNNDDCVMALKSTGLATMLGDDRCNNAAQSFAVCECEP